MGRVLELFKLAHNGRELSAAFYRWRYEKNPFGPPMIDLMFDGDQVVGHYAVSPTEGNFFGKEFSVVLSMNTFSHPQYWGKGIFTTLAKNLYKRIADDHKICLVYGFPNKNSHYGLIQKLFWKDVFIIPTTAVQNNLKS